VTCASSERRRRACPERAAGFDPNPGASRWAAALALACLPAILLAQTSRDFVRGAAIHTDTGSLFRIELPDDVYETVTRSDLGDLRVLNASGEPVPHTLREAPAPAGVEAEWRTVPSFPMADVQDGSPAKTHVRVDTNGAVLEVTNGPAHRFTTAYLVDATSLDAPVTRIALSWKAAPATTFLARVSVQASNDLDAWRTVVPSAAVAQLQRDTYTLMQSEIELPVDERARYLRISWPKELAAVTLTAVRVRRRADEQRAPTHWKTLSAARVDSTGAAAYDTNGMFPVQYVDLDFADAADVASVTIQSRAETTVDWGFRHAGLFYVLRESDSVVRSGATPIQRTTDRYWRVVTTRPGGWKGGAAPRLKIGWHPHEVVFVAHGPAPYTLVYGSGRVAGDDAPVDALLASLNDSDIGSRVHRATLDAPHTLGGTDALAAAPQYRRFVLWGVLIVAVGALALFAMRTFRETNAAS
jgi:hypothetical protein